MSTTIDASRRPDPILTSTAWIDNDILKRVANIALPFISFYKPLSTAITLGMGGYQFKKLSENTYENWTSNNRQVIQNSIRIVVLTASVAMSVLSPGVMAMTTHSYAVAEALTHTLIHLYAREKYEALESFGSALINSVQLGSHVFGGPYLLALAYAVHSLHYFYVSISEAKDEQYIEMVAHILLGGISAYQMRPHLQNIYKRHFSDTISQKELDEFIELINRKNKEEKGSSTQKKKLDFRSKEAMKLLSDSQGKGFLNENDLLDTNSSSNNYISPWEKSDIKIDLEDYLDKKGLNKSIIGLEIDLMNSELNNMVIRNITFDSCMFLGSISWTNFDNVQLKNCNFSGIYLQEVNFVNCNITSSWFANAIFRRCFFANTRIQGSNLEHLSVIDSQFTNVELVEVSLNRATFLLTSLEQVVFKCCETIGLYVGKSRDKVKLVQTEILGSSKPIIALGIDMCQRGRFGCYIQKALTNLGARVVLYPHSAASMTIDHNRLVREINTTRASDQMIKYTSISEGIFNLSDPSGEVEKVRKFAQRLVNEVDGVVLPGGDNIEPFFYQLEGKIGGFSPAKSLLEMGLILEVKKSMRTMLLGVCRGSQALNVAFGGTLKNTKKGHGFQLLEPLSQSKVTPGIKKVFGGLLETGYTGYSCHEQSVDHLAPELTTVLSYKGCIKATISKCERLIGLQFHPEKAVSLSSGHDCIELQLSNGIFSSRSSVAKMIAIGASLPNNTQRTFWRMIKGMSNLARFDIDTNFDIYRRFIQLVDEVRSA